MRNICLITSIFLSSLIYFQASIAQVSSVEKKTDLSVLYCEDRQLGQYFECVSDVIEDVEIEEVEALEGEQEPIDPFYEQEEEAISELEIFKEKIDRAWKLALMKPGPKTYYRYLAIQKEALNRASIAADWHRRTVYSNPELDYTAIRPVNSRAINARNAELFNTKADFFAGMSKRYGIFYIYSGNCVPCNVYSPMLKRFSERHKINVMVISKDGSNNTHFDNVVYDDGRLARMGFDKFPTPTTVVLDSQDGSMKVLGAGVLSTSEIENRIYELYADKPGDEF